MAVEFGFPKQKPQFYTMISLRKYQRPRPGRQVTTDLAAAIRLPLPTNLTDSFGIETNNNTKLDLLGNAPSDVIAAGKTKLESYAAELRGGKGLLQFIKDTALEVAAVAPGISDTNIGAVAQLETGMIRNPHLTTIFDGVRLKSFRFSWKLSPRSEDEAREMENLINYIKAYMHPDLIGGGFALEYPYLSEVQFVVGDNKILPNVKTSFITGLEVNNAASQAPAFYKDGKTVSAELSLSFQEINIQTRRDFLGAVSVG